MNVSWDAPDIETSSAGYARRFSGKAGTYMLASQTRALQRALRACRPGRVLDVGGAHGQLVDPLRALGWSVTVTGSSVECERNLRELHGKHSCAFVRANILDLPFPDSSFDLVTSVRLLSHVDDWQRLIAELCRVTSNWVLIDYPSTVAVNALTPVLFPIKKRLEGNTRTYRSFSHGQLSKAFEVHGFRPGVAVKQFVLPMGLHRALGSAAPLRLTESVSRLTGLTALVGSPVILRADKAVSVRRRGLRVLLVAPQPFYQERGTPIAVRMLAETLCGAGHTVDLLTYHEGSDVAVPGLRIVRAPRIPGVSRIPIGISWKKLVCDLSLSIQLARLMRRGQHDVIHAVEESVFPAALFNVFARKRLVYDMDSILSDQLVRKWRFLSPLASVLRRIERWAIRRADWVFPVCDDLAQRVRAQVPTERVVILPDTPLPQAGHVPAVVEDLRVLVDGGHLIALYVGNLEPYQGVDLMMGAFARLPPGITIDLVIIGGNARHIDKQAARARAYGIAERVHFLGPKPLEWLNAYLQQADILVSPRAWGCNVPLKVYSYMKTGKPILATRIRAHTQVLDDGCAILCEPNPEALAEGLVTLRNDHETCLRLGRAARARVEAEYSLEAFQHKLLAAYERMSVVNA
jgi:glycosyltransferase involved in cell wall biosynthesis